MSMDTKKARIAAGIAAAAGITLLGFAPARPAQAGPVHFYRAHVRPNAHKAAHHVRAKMHNVGHKVRAALHIHHTHDH